MFKNKFIKPISDDVEKKGPYETRLIFRLFWLWSPIFFIVIFTASFSYISLTAKTIEDDVSQVHLEVARRAESTIKNSIGARIDAQARLSFEITDLSRDREAALALFMRANPEFENVSLISLSGETALYRDRYVVVDPSKVKNYSGQDNFLEALKGNNSIGSVFISSRGEPLITITTPVTSLKGDVEGAIVADLNLKFMWKLMEDIRVGRNGKAYVVDQYGNLIADPNSSLVLQRINLLNRPIVRKLLAGSQEIDGLDSSLRYLNTSGVQAFSTGLRIDPYGWAVITEEPISEALLASQRTEIAGIVFSVSIALMLLVLMVVIRRLITSNSRANDINAKLDKVAKGLARREAELAQANERLQELDQTKSDFLSVAAHQLRTPLSAVHWANSVLLEEHMGTLTPEQKSYIMKAEESNSRMVHLIDDMLTITRIESGKMDYHFYVLSLNDILSTMASDFMPKAQEKGLIFSYTAEPDISSDVSVDSEKIRYIFENLLENAMRYTPRGGIVAMTLARKGNMISVTVKDSGIGISEKEKKNIFMKFFRATNATRAVTDGSGLGLFVAKNIAEKHGGTIGFDSELGKGSTFTVLLPAAGTAVSPLTGSSAIVTFSTKEQSAPKSTAGGASAHGGEATLPKEPPLAVV